MKHIWAPWRIEYVRMEKPEGCILCEKPRQGNDALNYILYRGDKNFVIPENADLVLFSGGRPVGHLTFEIMENL